MNDCNYGIPPQGELKPQGDLKRPICPTGPVPGPSTQQIYDEALKIAELREAAILRLRELLQDLEQQTKACYELLARLEQQTKACRG